jgi:hypothetical protein
MILVFRKKRKKPFFHTDFLYENILYWLSLLIIIPLVISVCLIYPREHYLLVLFAILLVLAAVNVPAIPVKWRFRWGLPLLMVLVLYWIPWQATGGFGVLPGEVESIHHKKCTNLGKIKFIRNLKVNTDIFYLGGSGSMEPYIDNFKYVDKRWKNVPFNRYLEVENINMIEVNNSLTGDPKFIADKQFKVFISEIPGNDWLKMKMPRCNGYLAVKKEILITNSNPGNQIPYESESRHGFPNQ